MASSLMSLDALQRLVLDRAAPTGEWRGDLSEDEYDWKVSSMDVNVRVRLPLRAVHTDPAAAFADALPNRAGALPEPPSS